MYWRDVPYVGASYCVLAWADGERGEAHGGTAQGTAQGTPLLRDAVSECGANVTWNGCEWPEGLARQMSQLSAHG